MTSFINFPKKTASNVVVRFHEDFSEPGFANRIVFGIKLVKSVEGIPILKFVKSRGGKKKIRKSVHMAFCRSAKIYFRLNISTSCEKL